MVPSPEKYFVESPLYEEFAIDGDGAKWHSVWIEFFVGGVDCHCVHCGRSSVLRGTATLPSVSRNPTYQRLPDSETELGPKYQNALLPTEGGGYVTMTDVGEYGLRERVFRSVLVCTRCKHDALIVLTRVADGKLSKIGQFPSRAELELPTLAKYRASLGDERYRELVRGVGLASHGVGIGSFAYLRRVFEHLVGEAAVAAARHDADWDEARFQSLRMAEKIKALENYLPPFLVEHRSLYGDLSDGLHNQTEDGCLKMFQPILVAIEVILDQRLEEAEREKKEKKARDAIQQMRNPGA